MSKRQRTQLILGILLILFAGWLILSKFLNIQINYVFSWPVWVILSGAFIFLIGLLVGAPGMAVPACIVSGIGGILYYQNMSEQWNSWSYLWTLIPGFVGIGILLSALLEGRLRQEAGDSLNILVVSAILFTIFGTMFGGWALFGEFSDYAPIALLFLLGLWLLVRGIFHRRSR